MIIRALNIGMPKRELLSGKEFLTAICKHPVNGEVFLSAQGFEGDGVGDRKHHGGSDKAVCVYSRDHYPFWEELLGSAMPDAAFGENLSVAGMAEADVCIGDVHRIGSAITQVSQPRQPCGTLAARYNRPDLIARVVDSGKTGFYLRVMTEGRVKAGDVITLIERDSRSVSIAFANHVFHHARRDRDGIDRVLSVPALSASWRASFLELRRKA